MRLFYIMGSNAYFLQDIEAKGLAFTAASHCLKELIVCFG